MPFQIEGVVKPFAAEGAQVALKKYFFKSIYIVIFLSIFTVRTY
jgi:hypothetical protein